MGLGYEHKANWQVYSPDGRRKYLDAQERARFLVAAAAEVRGVRTLCEFLLFTGCRISEALALRRDQLDAEAGTVLIRTLKRRKIVFRRVPVSADMMAALLAIAPPNGRVWPIHRTTAWRWIVRVMERAKIEGPMACCRGARHGYAIHAAAARVPPNLIQKWMGHASLSTTVIYLDAVGPDERIFATRMW